MKLSSAVMHLQCIADDMRALQVWNEEDPENEVLALVVRTGLNSAMGKMLCQNLCPVDSGNWKQVSLDLLYSLSSHKND